MPLANLTELIWEERMIPLLRTCGIPERYLGAQASDYERFFAVCSAAPLLKGHPMPIRLSAFLRQEMGVACSLCAQNAAQIWKKACRCYGSGLMKASRSRISLRLLHPWRSQR